MGQDSSVGDWDDFSPHGGILLPLDLEERFFAAVLGPEGGSSPSGVKAWTADAGVVTEVQMSITCGEWRRPIMGFAQDYAAVQFVIEESTAMGCSRIACVASSPLIEKLEEQRPDLLRHIELLDTDGHSRDQVAALLSGLAEQIGITQEDLCSPCAWWDIAASTDMPVAEAFRRAYDGCYSLFLGAKHGIAVDVDVSGLAQDLCLLRGVDERAESRRRLSYLEALARSYVSEKVTGVSLFRSRLCDEFLDELPSIVAEAEYEMYSEAQANMAVLRRFRTARADFGRHARRLVRTLQSTGLLAVGSWALKRSTGWDPPADRLITNALGVRRLPLVQPLTSAVNRARTAWSQQHPEYVPFGDGASRARVRNSEEIPENPFE